MHKWCPQQFRKNGNNKGIDPSIVENAIQHARLVTEINPKLPPIFSLKHLAHLTGVDYALLRSSVERKSPEPYKVFRLNKKRINTRRNSYRIICVPDDFLMKTQRWITQNILKHCVTHSASKAYAENCKIIDAANLHCGCKWMIKLDVKNFFESFSEISAYRIFRSFGYQPLISLELSRLCTRLGTLTNMRKHPNWLATEKNYNVIKKYRNNRIGHFPQGAPTSPMLSNLAMIEFDKKVENIANNNGLFYSRYADDLCLSTSSAVFDRNKAKKVIGAIYNEMRKIGLEPNLTKTQVLPPGARKIVLGLLVDSERPRLSREFRSKMRMHLYFMTHSDVGPALHASKRGFESVLGLKNHIEGLITYARQIDAAYASTCSQQMLNIDWPI